MLVIFGSESSPYSVKVRAYCRYKEIAHSWRVRNAENQDDYVKVLQLCKRRLPLIPIVQKPDGSAMQDSTPIMECVCLCVCAVLVGVCRDDFVCVCDV